MDIRLFSLCTPCPEGFTFCREFRPRDFRRAPFALYAPSAEAAHEFLGDYLPRLAGVILLPQERLTSEVAAPLIVQIGISPAMLPYLADFAVHQLAQLAQRVSSEERGSFLALENERLELNNLRASEEFGRFRDSLLHEIEERRAAERQLAESEELLRLIMSSTVEAIYGIDTEGLCTFANESCLKLLGYDHLGEVLGHNMHDMIHCRTSAGQIMPMEECRIFRAFREGVGITVADEVFWRRDGSPVPVEYSSYPIRKDGVVVGAVVTWRDITDRRASEQKMALMSFALDNIHEAAYLIDENSRFTFVNAESCRALGYSQKELLSMGVTDVDAEFLPENWANHWNELKTRGSLTFESRHCTQSGELFPVEVNTSYFVFDGKEYNLALVRDISERKQSELALRESEENWRGFAGLTSDYVHKCTRSGTSPFRLKWIGGGLDAISGYSADEVFELGCWLPLVHSDDRQKVASYLSSLVPGDLKEVEFRLVTKQGETRWISEKSRCVAGDNEGELILSGAATDITGRWRAEEELRKTQELFDLFMKYTPVYTFIKQIEGAKSRVIQISDNFIDMLGRPSDELRGRTMEEIFPPDFARKITEDDLAVFKEGKVMHLDEEFNDRFYSTIKFPILKEGGDKFIAGFTIDITERRKAEEERHNMEKQLLHAQKLESLGVLAGAFAHDFNNILMAIIGNADLALMRLNKESPAVENLHRIEQAAARAADLAKQMLAYSGRGKFIVENIDMNILLEEMLHMLEVSISKKAVLRLNQYLHLPSVEADATQMRQIIMNLVINASEAIGDKSGVIAISTGCMDCDRSYLKDIWLDENLSDGLYVYLEIADSGCGMDKETLAKLFDPFFTTKFTGRGLGMAAVLGIVRGHKGAIKVYSEPGKGTTFKILLPASGKPAELFNGETHKDDWQGSGTVLLVDDEETIRGVGSEMLKDLGFAVITADDGREGIAAFKQNPDISFVILDLTMPHMDGEQCFRELRQLKPDIKVIMSSGFNEQEVAQKFIGKGLAGFLQKPYKLSALKNTIQSILA